MASSLEIKFSLELSVVIGPLGEDDLTMGGSGAKL